MGFRYYDALIQIVKSKMSKAGHEYFSWKNEIEYNILREVDLKTLILKQLGFKQSN
jgi:hypothetical protein